MSQERSMDEILRLIREMCADEERATARESESPGARADASSAEIIDFNKARSGREVRAGSRTPSAAM